MFSYVWRRLRLRSRWRQFRERVDAIGFRAATLCVLQHRFGRWCGSIYSLRPRGVDHPVMIRRRSTDINVFNQIFVGREYECLDEMDNVRLVIDCGANVGFSSVYFLSRHPRCEVIAIEPDAGNFEMLQRNLAPYADRVKLIRAGVWSHTTQLVMAENEYRGGREWSRQVRLCRPDEKADFEAVDIGSLLDGSGYQWISILKIDVEGTEAVIFRENYESWMERTDTIVIELHDDSMFGKGSEVFHSAIEGRDFKISKSGELTVCRSPGRRP